jgi:hypothetical protein
MELTARQSIGSFNLKNTFVSLGGDNKRLNYYAYYQINPAMIGDLTQVLMCKLQVLTSGDI